MKNIITFFIVSAFLVLYSCSPMDYKYSDFIKDGPITYLTKLDDSEVKGIGGRNRIRIVIPELEDPRATKVELYWFNKQEHLVAPISTSGETSVYIENLVEASYIFELSILDEKGNKSIPVAITATSYGEIWESLLQNRLISSKGREGANYKVTYAENMDQRLQATEFEWKSDDGLTSKLVVNPTETVGYLENFESNSFRYRSVYRPEPESEDLFYSPWEYYLEVPSADLVIFDKEHTSFTMPELNDGYWGGYEFIWIDKSTGEQKSQITETNTITLQNYNGMSVRYRALYDFEGVSLYSDAIEYSTVRYVDLDRSKWYAAPETRISDGSPLANNSFVQVTEKNKSPYLSHPLFYAASGTDAQMHPMVHFDGNVETYLSMVKGYGETYLDNRNKTGTVHSYGGVSSDGNDIYFIIDLGSVSSFNYFRIAYRTAQANGNLKPQKISLYGSNDPDCIIDMTKWSTIQDTLDLPGNSLASNTGDANHPGRVTGNVVIPESNYRYIMLRYDAWTASSNSMAIAEFYLGLYY